MSKILIEEYIRQVLIKEETTDKRPTFGELKSFLQLTAKKKLNSKRLGYASNFIRKIVTGGIIPDEILQSGTETVIDYLKKEKGVDLSKFTPKKIIAKFYGINDEKGLDVIELPDEVSNIADDKLEENFLYDYLISAIENENDNDIIPSEWTFNQFKKFTKDHNEKTKGYFVSE